MDYEQLAVDTIDLMLSSENSQNIDDLICKCESAKSDADVSNLGQSKSILHHYVGNLTFLAFLDVSEMIPQYKYKDYELLMKSISKKRKKIIKIIGNWPPQIDESIQLVNNPNHRM